MYVQYRVPIYLSVSIYFHAKVTPTLVFILFKKSATSLNCCLVAAYIAAAADVTVSLLIFAL